MLVPDLDEIREVHQCGSRVCSLSADRTARIWDVKDGTTLALFHCDAMSIAVSETTLYAGMKSGLIYQSKIPPLKELESISVTEGVQMNVQHKSRISLLSLTKTPSL